MGLVLVIVIVVTSVVAAVANKLKFHVPLFYHVKNKTVFILFFFFFKPHPLQKKTRILFRFRKIELIIASNESIKYICQRLVVVKKEIVK